jgi:hypothetical protein
MKFACHALAGLLVALLTQGALSARTIELSDADCERMAAIAEEAPRLSWAGYEPYTGCFDATWLDMQPSRAFLIRYPLDKIPKGQRITKAEWVVPVQLTSAGEQRLHIRRILAEWGPGVCHQYRMARPNKVEWKQAGARGASSDRAPKDSALVKITQTTAHEHVVNVTEDVELWYTGAGANHGWMITCDDPDVLVRLPSPFNAYGKGKWKLRITYEPE